ncbi:helix-turn-helix transcriptional regulator [Dyadobacter sp. OTU695]|uniref:helix-turn-helix transcriptional regulator n=1 Tax=Dyadobacter sp. OTU695 TaxID=3043860 RepID=UPI00313DFE6D
MTLLNNPFIDLSLLRKIWKSDVIESEIQQMDEVVRNNPLLEETLRIRKASLAVIDLRTMQYLRTFGDPLAVTGWNKDEFLNGGVLYFMSKLPPNDFAGVEKMSRHINEYVRRVDQSSINSFKAFFDFRMTRPDGSSRRILHESSALRRDSAGNILFLLGLISDISHQKRGNSQHLRLTDGRENLIYKVDSDTGESTNLELLSDRELEIAKLVGQKLSSQEIAQKLFLSIHTVNTHRQNMLRKMNMSDMMELLNFLSAYQVV